MKTFIKDLINFNTKYNHIPLILFCILYLFSPIDFLPEMPIKYWYSYIDDVLVLIATGVIIYIDKGGVLNVQKSGRIKKFSNNTTTRSDSTNTNNTASVKTSSSTNGTTYIDSNSDKCNIFSDAVAKDVNESEITRKSNNAESTGNTSDTELKHSTSATNETEHGIYPRDTNNYISELRQKSREGGFVVQSKTSCW